MVIKRMKLKLSFREYRDAGTIEKNIIIMNILTKRLFEKYFSELTSKKVGSPNEIKGIEKLIIVSQ